LKIDENVIFRDLSISRIEHQKLNLSKIKVVV